MKSLLKICMDFLASNIDLLDSLCGFPDAIGKDIFKYIVEHNCFANPRQRASVLKVFADAYGDCGFLDSLCLRHRHLFLNDVMDVQDTGWVFQSLQHLDLTSCGLGDWHEILMEIGTLHRLETLLLSENGLSDEGVRRMTARLRMQQVSNFTLKRLDLSRNGRITVRCLGFLQNFAALMVVRLTSTSVTTHKFVPSHKGNKKWSISPCTCALHNLSVVTEGWAAGVMKTWMTMYDTKTDQRLFINESNREDWNTNSDLLSSHVKKFYGKKRKYEELCANPPSSSFRTTQELILTTVSFTCEHSPKSKQVEDVLCNTELDKHANKGNCNLLKSTQQTKCFKLHNQSLHRMCLSEQTKNSELCSPKDSFNSADQLLSQYMGTGTSTQGGGVQPRSKKLSLIENLESYTSTS